MSEDQKEYKLFNKPSKIDKIYTAKLENKKSTIKIEASCPHEIINCIIALEGADKISIEIIERTETPSWSLSGSSRIDKITDHKIILRSAWDDTKKFTTRFELNTLQLILNNFFEVE